jgi:hypothetical protein
LRRKWKQWVQKRKNGTKGWGRLSRVPPDSNSSKYGDREETEKTRREEDKSAQLEQIIMNNMRSTKSGNPITDPKSAMRLPTCPPPIDALEIINPNQNQQPNMAVGYKNNGRFLEPHGQRIPGL